MSRFTIHDLATTIDARTASTGEASYTKRLLEKGPEHCAKKLGIGHKQTTPDGLFTLKEGECLGACGDAPVALVNNKRMCSFMSNDKIDRLIEELSVTPAQAGAQGD